MSKSYFDCMKELSSEDLYCGLLGYGLFSDKIPPLFTSEKLLEYSRSLQQPFSDCERQYVFYENMRNTNIPRPHGIPHPFAYQKLCYCLSDNWENLLEHFESKTRNQEHKVSRIHVRKLKGKQHLFEMNYKSWKTDPEPETDLLMGMRYVAEADISNCFPSVYSHSIPWALVGKATAKGNRKQGEWFNKIDHFVQRVNNGETHGLLIGPHSSNLLAEIILVSVDYELCSRGWMFVRNIDDYRCYVESYEKAQVFLNDLRAALRVFDLSLNHKKSKIAKLPKTSVEQWVNRINSFILEIENECVSYRQAKAYLDQTIELMEDNNQNSSILKYAIKPLSKKPLSVNAKKYCTKTLVHYSLLYPYLFPMLDEYVIESFSVELPLLKKLTNLAYSEGLASGNYEEACYALYYALKYEIDIADFKVDAVIDSGDCLLLEMAALLCRKNKDNDALEILKKKALELSKDEDDFGRYWLFVYENLSLNQLSDDWKSMKKAGVSFIKPEKWLSR